MNGYREENLNAIKALINRAAPNEKNAFLEFLKQCELEEKRLKEQLQSSEAKADMMTKRSLSKDKRRINSVAAAGRLRERRKSLLKEIAILNRQKDDQAREIQRLQELLDEFKKR